MRSARVALTTLRRLDKVATLLVDDDGQPRQGVMLLPPMLGLDAWEAMAVPMQAKLLQECAGDGGRSAPAVEPVDHSPVNLSTSYSLHTGKRYLNEMTPDGPVRLYELGWNCD